MTTESQPRKEDETTQQIALEAWHEAISLYNEGRFDEGLAIILSAIERATAETQEHANTHAEQCGKAQLELVAERRHYDEAVQRFEAAAADSYKYAQQLTTELQRTKQAEQTLVTSQLEILAERQHLQELQNKLSKYE